MKLVQIEVGVGVDEEFGAEVGFEVGEALRKKKFCADNSIEVYEKFGEKVSAEVGFEVSKEVGFEVGEEVEGKEVLCRQWC
jgi:hypothetical protein